MHIVEDGRGYLEHLLVNGELDVAVIVAGAEKNNSALKVESVETSRYRVWLPAGHALAESERISVRELAARPLVLLNVDEIAEAAEEACRLAGVRPAIAIRTQSVEAARSLVATGAGVAVAAGSRRTDPGRSKETGSKRVNSSRQSRPVDVASHGGGERLCRPPAQQFVALVRAFRGGAVRGSQRFFR